MKLSLWPLLGFINSKPRHEVPLNALTGPSLDWLVGRKRYRRRPGREIQIDTLAAGVEVDGLLESAWGALARRMISAALRSLTNAYPTWLILYTLESARCAQIAFRSTNGTDAVRVLGDWFGAFHYGWPTSGNDGVPTFRVMPHFYKNEHGGVTIARLNYDSARRHAAGGSRDILHTGDKEIVWPGGTSHGGRWDGGFNDSDSAGDEVTNVSPLGMIPPLQIPPAAAGNDLGTGDQSSWIGSDVFFYTWVFWNKRGECSTYPIPQPPDSAWPGYGGFGYFQVDPANPTHYYDSVVFPAPIGPPGTEARSLLRSTKVNITSTTDVNFPSPADLYFAARIDNNTETTLVLRDGNDLSLDASPIPTQLRKRLWPPCARAMGNFDGRYLLGSLSTNPHAMLAAPWDNANVNMEIDDPDLYDGPEYYIAITEAAVVLRKVELGVVTDRSITIAGRSLKQVTALIATNQVSNTVIETGHYSTGNFYLAITGVPTVTVGDEIKTTMTDFSPGTRVTGMFDAGGGVWAIILSQRPLVSNSSPAPAKAVEFTSLETDEDDPRPWGCVTVPGADADAPAESLLRTRIAADAVWGSADTTLAVTSGDLAQCAYITPGMRVYHGDFAVGTEVIDVDRVTGIVTVDTPSTSANGGASEEVVFAYDTGDSQRADSEDIAATGAATNAVSSAQMVITTPNNAAGTTDDNDATLLLVTYTSSDATTSSASERFAITAMTGNGDTIYSVRVAMKVKTLHTAGAPVVTFQPFINGTAYGTAQSVTDALALDWIYFDFELNPVTGLAWTKTALNSYSWGVYITATRNAVGANTGITVAEVQVSAEFPKVALDPGFIRAYGNCWPAPLFFNLDYLDTFDEREQDLIFSGASPGHAQNAVNSYYIGNQHSGLASKGKLMGFADLGPAALVFFAKARSRLWNPRTGTTHADEDYTLSTVSWTRGARSPYAICPGNLWCFFLSDEGFFACNADTGEELISKSVYDDEAPVGERGELEYAIGACISASESDSDDYRIHAQVHGSVLSVRYWSNAEAGHCDRELRYDFSEGVGRTGLAEVLRRDGTPYPWSAPLSLEHSVSAWVTEGDGKHHYAAIDSNDGTADGRVDEIDTGTEDNGTPVRPVGYTGVAIPEDLSAYQPTMARILSKKAGDGLSVALCRQPEREPDEADWDELLAESTHADAFGRDVVWLKGNERGVRSAIACKLSDDGTGPCPEVSAVLIDVEPRASNTKIPTA